MFFIKSNSKNQNLFKSLTLATMLVCVVLLDTNLPKTAVHSQYDTVEAKLFGWERDVDVTRAYIGGKVVYTERLKIFGIPVATRETTVQL